MVDYSKMSSDDLRQRIGINTTELPKEESDLEIHKAENTLMLAELRKRESEK